MSDAPGRARGGAAEPGSEGRLLWQPAGPSAAATHVERYRRWLGGRGVAAGDYAELWRWSVQQPEPFWSSLLDHFEIEARGEREPVRTSRRPGEARWFPGLELNYAFHALRHPGDRLAIRYVHESGAGRTLTWAELGDAVARAAAGLRRLGVGEGDRVAAYLPNVPEAVIGFLASASLGAVWSLCSPDLGPRLVLDRFRQIEPRVLVASRSYEYGGQRFDRSAVIEEIAAGLPTLEALVALEGSGAGAGRRLGWDALLSGAAEPGFAPVPFGHPLWIVYTSGTTGLPKPIVHGHGGILLEHQKLLGLQLDLGPGDAFFWLTSTGWIMWNLLVGGLLRGSTVVLYDGHPSYPGPDRLWALADREGVTYFGVGASYLHGCLKADLRPRERLALGRLRGVGSTGSPLSPAGFEWAHRHVGEHVPVGSVCGGTDVASAFVGPCPTLPVFSGEIQCRCLGVAAEAYGPDGRPVQGSVGELVIEQPMPSMPLRFWNDPDGRRYRASYFERFEGVWTHGDWVRFTERGSCVVYGRSDATLNRGGIRLGTRDYYDLVEAFDEVESSLVIDTSELGKEGLLVLFVVLAEGRKLDAALEARIAERIRTQLSPRHRPDAIRQIRQVPTTLTGKKLEIPVKRLLSGVAPERAVARSAVANPEALDEIVELARSLPGAPAGG
jgi:acetoacetyl-CoA synthetase